MTGQSMTDGMIRLYGTAKGNGSWARVSAGVREGLAEMDALASFYDVGRVDVDYDDDGDALDEGYDAPVGLCIGAPPAASVMVGRGDHTQRLLMIATNSSWLSEVMMRRAAKICTGFVAPSKWAASVIERYAHGLPVCVYPHGVDSGFVSPSEFCVPSGPFRAVHLASTHMQRKATAELIHAWARSVKKGWLPDDALLRLVVDGPSGYFEEEIHEASEGHLWLAERFLLQQRLGLKVADMCALMRDHHLVVQPSRAEGFGMVPLEARAAGVPVVATICTGHAEHMGLSTPGVVPVGHELNEPIDDGPGAFAPGVKVDAIVDALRFAHANYDQLALDAHRAAPSVRHRWSWPSVTGRFMIKNQDLLLGGRSGIIG